MWSSREDWKQYRKNLEAERKIWADTEAQLVVLREEYQRKINNLRSKFERDKETLELEFKETLKRLQTKYAKNRTKVMEEHREKVLESTKQSITYVFQRGRKE